MGLLCLRVALLYSGVEKAGGEGGGSEGADPREDCVGESSSCPVLSSFSVDCVDQPFELF